MWRTRSAWGCGYAIVTPSRRRGAWLRDVWSTLAGSQHPSTSGLEPAPLDLAPDRMEIAYLEEHPEPIAADAVDLPSWLAQHLAAEGVRLLVPLVAQGRLMGLLSLGQSRAGAAYSAEDLAFLTTLADEAAAAARIIVLLAGAAAQRAATHRPAGNANGCGGVSSPTST
jgi:GAF domain-containing protein